MSDTHQPSRALLISFYVLSPSHFCPLSTENPVTIAAACINCVDVVLWVQNLAARVTWCSNAGTLQSSISASVDSLKLESWWEIKWFQLFWNLGVQQECDSTRDSQPVIIHQRSAEGEGGIQMEFVDRSRASVKELERCVSKTNKELLGFYFDLWLLFKDRPSWTWLIRNMWSSSKPSAAQKTSHRRKWNPKASVLSCRQHLARGKCGS